MADMEDENDSVSMNKALVIKFITRYPHFEPSKILVSGINKLKPFLKQFKTLN